MSTLILHFLYINFIRKRMVYKMQLQMVNVNFIFPILYAEFCHADIPAFPFLSAILTDFEYIFRPYIMSKTAFLK